MRFGAGKNGLVNFAIGILGHHCSQRTVGSHWATSVTDGKVAAGQAIFVFNQMLRAFDEIAPRPARFKHTRQVGLPEHVSEEILRITGNPAVALGDSSFCVDRNELV